MYIHPWPACLKDERKEDRFLIYGTGEFAKSLYIYLCRCYPSFKVVGFLDTFNTGTFVDLPVFKPENIEVAYDRILIASSYGTEISKHLDQLSIHSYKVMPHHGGVYFGLHTTDGQFGVAPDIEVSLKQVLDLLETPQDRDLFSRVIQARCGNFAPLKTYQKQCPASQPRQYLDFIRHDVIQLVVDAGFYCGDTAQRFYDNFPALSRVIGMEPVMEVWEKSPLRDELESRVEVYPYALWHVREKLPFLSDDEIREGVPGGASRVPGPNEDATRYVEGMPLDTFVEDHQLKRLDLLKMDIEGSEPEALKGALASLKRFRPQLLVCLYHHKEHLYEIPLWLRDNLENYTYHFNHHSQNVDESVLYCIPNEIKNSAS